MVAVVIMFCGIGIIGAVAAVVAFGFASRLTRRLEATVLQVESQVEHVQARRGTGPRSGLRELIIGVADTQTAASLTWLLARLGWHPEAGDGGVSWQDGGLLIRIAGRPWDPHFGVQGRLTFSAGDPDRLLRICREALRHGFHVVVVKGAVPKAALTAPLGSAERPAGVGVVRADGAPTGVDARTGEEADGRPVTLRTASGFEVMPVAS